MHPNKFVALLSAVPILLALYCATPASEPNPDDHRRRPTMLREKKATPEQKKCMDDCLEKNRARAAAWEEIRRQCATQCGFGPIQ